MFTQQFEIYFLEIEDIKGYIGMGTYEKRMKQNDGKL